MKITMLKSKIHRATVTEANLDYEGSISIDRRLCDAAEFFQFEKVEIYNCNNGARFSTYVIYGGEREICLNGAAARQAHRGDRLIICTYGEMDKVSALSYKPKVILVDENNEPKNNV